MRLELSRQRSPARRVLISCVRVRATLSFLLSDTPATAARHVLQTLNLMKAFLHQTVMSAGSRLASDLGVCTFSPHLKPRARILSDTAIMRDTETASLNKISNVFILVNGVSASCLSMVFILMGNVHKSPN